MTEKINVGDRSVTYSGIFNMYDVYKILDDWQKKNNYDKTEKESKEFITPEGKYLEFYLEPARKESDYVRFVIKINIKVRNLKETVVEIDGEKRNMHEGELEIGFGAWLDTDYEEAWSTKPGLYFLRILMDKYIYKMYTSKFVGKLKGEMDELVNQVKSFLNLYKFQ